MELKLLFAVMLFAIQTRKGICTIQILAESGVNQDTYTLHHSGTADNVINRAEVEHFGLRESELLRAGHEHFGARPNSAFLHDPTTWGFKYHEYGWPEVECRLAVMSARLIPESSSQLLLFSTNLTNTNTEFDADHLIRLSESTTNTVTSAWMGTNSVSFEKVIRYGFRFGGGQFSMSYTSSWGEGQSLSQRVTVEMASEKRITLGPGESARVEMFVTRRTIQLDIDYIASVTGRAFLNYDRRHNGHHFWGVEINSLMRSGRIPTTLASRESANVVYATEGKVRVTNLNSRKMEEYPVVLKLVEEPEVKGTTTIICNKQ